MSVTRLKKQKSVRDQVSPRSGQAHRLPPRTGCPSLRHGRDDREPHLDPRPGRGRRVPHQPYGMLYEQMHASCFIKLDLEARSVQPDRVRHQQAAT